MNKTTQALLAEAARSDIKAVTVYNTDIRRWTAANALVAAGKATIHSHRQEPVRTVWRGQHRHKVHHSLVIQIVD